MEDRAGRALADCSPVDLHHRRLGAEVITVTITVTVHSFSSLGVRLRFPAGLSWRDAAAEEGFDRLDECRVAEGAPDAFRAAQPVMHGVVPLTPRQQGGDVGESWIEGAGRRGAVVTAG